MWAAKCWCIVKNLWNFLQIAVEWSDPIQLNVQDYGCNFISHRCRLHRFVKNCYFIFFNSLCNFSFRDLFKNFNTWWPYDVAEIKMLVDKKKTLFESSFCPFELCIIVSIDYIFYGVYCCNFLLYTKTTIFANVLSSIQLKQVLPMVLFFPFQFIHLFTFDVSFAKKKTLEWNERERRKKIIKEKPKVMWALTNTIWTNKNEVSNNFRMK